MSTTNQTVDWSLLQSTLVLGEIVEARDAYTGGHLWRVTQYARAIAEKLEMSRDEQYRLTLGAFLHDIGKVGIPDAILLKPSKLSFDEFAIMQNHPVIGAELISDHPLGDLVYDIVRHHHERLDGTGYPDRIGGSEISDFAGIISVADVFDALTSWRSYRPRIETDTAFQILDEARDQHVQGEWVDALRAAYREHGIDNILLHSSTDRALIECPGCGPIVVLPEDPAPGDMIHCPACLGVMTLHTGPDDRLVASPGEGKLAPSDVPPTADKRAVMEVLETLRAAAA